MKQASANAPTTSAGSSPRRLSWLADLLAQRSVRITVFAWLLANAIVLGLGRGTLPFDRPLQAGATAIDQVVVANVALIEVLLLMGIVWALTRRRVAPNFAARVPARPAALRETLGLLGYGALGLLGGLALGPALGWHPFGFHIVGTIFGTHETVETAEVVGWAIYNFVVYAVVPYLYFRRRYSNEDLSLTSSNLRNDVLVIVVVLVVEAVFQLVALSPAILSLTPRQLALGVPLTFGFYFLGTVLPSLIFIYSILVPRYLTLTGSAATAVILGGLTYTVLHIWDGWTALNSPRNIALSLSALFMLYFAPGLIKTFLTLRTGNAWVHVWAYHALVPHTLVDTPLFVKIFQIR